MDEAGGLRRVELERGRFGLERGRFGLYWLEIAGLPDGVTAVVVADVDGNPGPCAESAIESIAAEMTAWLPAGTEIRWFICHGWEDAEHSAPAVVEATFSAGFQPPAWRRMPRSHFEDGILNRRLGDPPQDLRDRVLEAGGEFEEPRVHRYRVVDVATLPLPHHLFKCLYADDFRREVDRYPEDSLQGSQAFYAAMTPERSQLCDYHRRLDWVAIANRAVQIVGEVGEEPDRDQLYCAVMESGLSAADTAMLHSLFGDPIVVGSENRYINGQHRGCGLRLSGASRTVIEAD